MDGSLGPLTLSLLFASSGVVTNMGMGFKDSHSGERNLWPRRYWGLNPACWGRSSAFLYRGCNMLRMFDLRGNGGLELCRSHRLRDSGREIGRVGSGGGA